MEDPRSELSPVLNGRRKLGRRQKDHKAVAKALRPIYAAPTAESAEAALAAFAASPLGREVSDHRAGLAAGLGARDPVFCAPSGGAARDHTTNAIDSLQSQLSNISIPRALPKRRCRPEAAVAGASQCPRRTGTISQGMERGDESVRHPIRRPVQPGRSVKPASHTEFLTGPGLQLPLGDLVRIYVKLLGQLRQSVLAT